jgi:integrase/recombinase XerD
MRLGELLSMKWDWIDLNKNIITVRCSASFTTKSKKERIIPINPSLRAVLINRLPKVMNISKGDFVFRKCENVKLNENYVSKAFKYSVREANVNESIHFHSLRHSFASNLVQKGVSLYVVKELLGHEDLQTTQIYSHLQKENLFQAVNLL